MTNKYIVYAKACPHEDCCVETHYQVLKEDADGEVGRSVICWHDQEFIALFCMRLLESGSQKLWEALHNELKEQEGL